MLRGKWKLETWLLRKEKADHHQHHYHYAQRQQFLVAKEQQEYHRVKFPLQILHGGR